MSLAFRSAKDDTNRFAIPKRVPPMHDDPYEVLGLATNADEATIRQTYLDLVRRFPPDRDPEQFARVRAAYEALRDPFVRLENLLFSIRGTDTLDAIRSEAIREVRDARIPTRKLLSLADAP